MSLSWYWPLARRGNSSGKEGIGFDEFSDDYLGNLTREVIQNSLDARKGNEPVSVEFSLFKTDASAFPAVQAYLFDYVNDWIERDKRKEKSAAKERLLMDKIFQCFLKSSQDGIVWLRISDKNTTGLRGVSTPMEENMPWFAFISGSGMDVKEIGSGGSKGLGKAAIFLNSAIRTIFVSTSTDLGETGNIGYAKLVSKRVDDDGRGHQDYTQGIGYCVSEENKNDEMNTPNEGLLNLDPSFIRDKDMFGTDIFVPFFFIEEVWASKMIGEAIISFLPALNDGDLEVIVNDTFGSNYFEVKKSNLYSAINNPLFFSKDSNMEIAKELYRTLNYPSVFAEEAVGTGRELKLLISSKSSTALNKVYSYRWKTKMRIEVFKTNVSMPYTAVLLIKGSELCEELKSVEDASHKKWSQQKYRDTNYSKEVIAKAINTVKDFAKEELEKIEESDYGKISDFDWANDEGWNSEESANTLDGTTNENLGLPTDEIVFEPIKKQDSSKKRKPRKPKATKVDPEGEADGYDEGRGFEAQGEELGSHPSGQNAGHENEPHPGTDDVDVLVDENGNKMMIRKPVSTISSKMPVKKIDEGLFDLIFVPSRSGEDVEIELLRSGYGDENEPATIISAFLDGISLPVFENKVYLDSIKKGQAYRISLKLKEHKIYVWEVNINANE